jgi:Cdc6-like AAA superfamily ATPase
MAKYNPFRPGSVVSPGMFSGRYEEIKAIKQALFQTKQGNPNHFLIEGERGIGKSSLFLLLDMVARGDIPFEDDKVLNFIVASVELREGMDHDDIVDSIANELRRELSKRQILIEACKVAWEVLSRFQVAGVKFDRSHTNDVGQRIDDLTNLLANIVQGAGEKIDGILVLIDEADKPGAQARLGELCKLLTERLSRRKCDKVCIGLAGLPGIILRLKESHESSARIFKVLHLDPLEDLESPIGDQETPRL